MIYSTNSYSVSLAKRIGVVSSVFLSVLDMFINGSDEKVILSRTYIYERTGIPADAQKSIESKLSKMNIISVRKVRNSNDKNYYDINYDILSATSSKSDIEEVFDVFNSTETSEKKKKKQSKETKKEQTIKKLKMCVDVSDEVIKQYIFDWIESVIESGNYLTQQSVKINVKQLMEYSKNQKDIIDVLLMSTKNSWRDFCWAMDKLKKETNSDRNFANYEDIKIDGESLSKEVF